jgi:hypothetical protein
MHNLQLQQMVLRAGLRERCAENAQNSSDSALSQVVFGTIGSNFGNGKRGFCCQICHSRQCLEWFKVKSQRSMIGGSGGGICAINVAVDAVVAVVAVVTSRFL